MLALLALAACGAEDEPVALPGAARPDIPVFEPSELEAEEPVSYQIELDFESVEKFVGHSWTFSTNRSVEQLLAFYEPLAVPVADASADDAAEEDEFEIDPGAEGWDDEDEDGDEGDEGEGAGEGRPGPALDRAGRTFRLAPADGIELEVTVYLQPRQRRSWFSILETRVADNP